MKKQIVFMYIALIFTLVLSSCGNSEERQEQNEDNIESTEVLDNLNEEIDQIETTDSGVTESGTSVSQTNDSSGLKVVKLNQVYMSPGGEDEVEFNISLIGNIIENVETLMIKGDDTSKFRMESFAKSVNDELKGKTIEEASEIKVIGGSSLTTGAFKNALKDLK